MRTAMALAQAALTGRRPRMANQLKIQINKPNQRGSDQRR